jgi:hypothetical protein
MTMDLRQTTEAILYRQYADPLGMYCPNPRAIEPHESIASKILLFCGNGFGKTYLAAHEFCLALTGRHWIHYCLKCGKVYPNNVGKCECGTVVIRKYYIPLFNENAEVIGSRFKPLDARICAEKDALTGGDATSNAIIPLVKRLLAPYLKPGFPKKEGKTYEFKWELTNGSFFDIYVYEQDDKAFESVSKDLIWFDEPFRESIYKATTARMRRGKGGRMIFALTPLLGSTWMYERFVDVQGEENKDVAVFHREIWDNCKCMTPETHDLKSGQPLDNEGHCTCHEGYIHKEAIERMIAEWEPEERDAREKGQFITLRDRVFMEFDPGVHVLNEELKPQDIVDKRLQLYAVCDPHMRRPPAWALYGIDPEGIIYVIDEFPNYFEGIYKGVFYEKIKDYNRGYDDTVKIFRDIELRWGGNIKKRFIDPRHGSTTLPNTGRMIMDEYRHTAQELGFEMRFRKARVGSDSMEGQIAAGMTLIKQKLRYNKDIAIGAGNYPGILVNPKCANHIRMFQYLRHDTKTGKPAEGKLASPTLVEKFKDFCDDLRYLVKSVEGYVNEAVEDKDDYVYQPACTLTGY